MRIFTACVVYLYCTMLYAQSDKVFFKNGSFLRGSVIEREISDTLYIKVERSIIRVLLDDVDEIRMGKRNGYRPSGYKDYMYPQGWSTVLEGGFIVGSHSKNQPPGVGSLIRLSQEYRVHPVLNGGVGVGFYTYQSHFAFPLSVNYHALLGRSRRSWMVFGRAGRGLVGYRDEMEGEKDIRGGFFYEAGIGWQRQVGTNSLRMKIGYSVQNLEERREINANYIQKRIRHMNRITVQVAYDLRYR